MPIPLAASLSRRRAQTLRSLLELPGPPLIIGVAGDSSAGKTTYTNGLRRMLGDDIVGTIEMDGYHKEDRATRARTGRSPLDPEMNHLGLLREHLDALRRGESVHLRRYDHGTGTFIAPQPFSPKPILVLEGLHALYPEFTSLLDYTVFVDPARDIKLGWKIARDTQFRGHRVEPLADEIRKREAAFRRWIEFQKTDANVVIKINRSKLKLLANEEYWGDRPPEGCFHMELIFQPAHTPLPPLRMSFSLAKMLGEDPLPFALAVVPRSYWGRRANAIHLDGLMPPRAVHVLQGQIERFTGIEVTDSHLSGIRKHERMPAIVFTQLLVTWPILEHIANLLEKRAASAGVTPVSRIEPQDSDDERP